MYLIAPKGKIIVKTDQTSELTEHISDLRTAELFAVGEDVSINIGKSFNKDSCSKPLVYFGQYFAEIPLEDIDGRFLVMEESNVFAVKVIED